LYHCDSWSESAPSGNAVAGIPYEELGWTDGNQPSCEQTLPLYCFVPAVGSDPTEVDTDGDGFDDGVEVAAGTDPVDAGDPPPAVPALPAAGLGLLAGALALMSASAARASRRSRS
jgi:hypothetical protein